MPDLISMGLGGGTIVRGTGGDVSVGPDSVGYVVVTEALCMGGGTLTLSDISLAGGRFDGFGDSSLVAEVDSATVTAALEWVDSQLTVMVDRIKSARADMPLLAVGGGAHLIPDDLPGVSEIHRPENYQVANAYGGRDCRGVRRRRQGLQLRRLESGGVS